MRGGSLAATSAFVAAFAGCTLFTPFGTDLTSGNGDGSPDATVPAGEAGADAGAETGVDARAVDCDAGGKVLPFRAFDMTPAPAATVGPVCNIDNALVEDGQVAGLDRSSPMEPVFFEHNVTGCIGVEFGASLREITVRAQTVAQGCNTPCSVDCGTGHTFYVYAGPTTTDLVYIKSVEPVTTSLVDYPTEVPLTLDARIVVVCRTAWGTARDDIAVDAIHGKCR